MIGLLSYILLCQIEVMCLIKTVDSTESCESQLPVLVYCLCDLSLRVNRKLATRYALTQKYQKNYPKIK